MSGKPRVPRTATETENVLDIVRSNRDWILPLFVHKVLYLGLRSVLYLKHPISIFGDLILSSGGLARVQLVIG